MGNNYIIDGSFQMIRTNPLLTTNLQIVIDSKYSIYLESINSHKNLNTDLYKHYIINKESYLEDKIPEFYNNLPINIAYYVKNNDDEDIVYNDYSNQFDNIYWSGLSKVKENKYYTEEFEYFAPLYVRPDDMPGGFIILRVEDPCIYELSEDDYEISNTTKHNFRSEIIDKWKCVSYFSMENDNSFGYWLNNNYISNPRFPKSPFEFDSKSYNFCRWYGINYFGGVYTDKSVYMEDKLWYENPHFKLEQFITEGFKNNELIFPNIANFKFLFDDSPASPFEFKKYTLNRYFGFYVDLEFIKTITPYRCTPIISGLKLDNNIFMSETQISGSTLPFKSWDKNKSYYIFAKNDLYKVERIKENNVYFYKIISNEDLEITDITRDNEVDIIFNDLGSYNYNNFIRPRNVTTLYYDKYISQDGLFDMMSDLYLIKINDKFHVLESKINEYDGLLEHYIRTDYGVSCNHQNLNYWLSNKNSGTTLNVETTSKPLTFQIYKVKFRDVKDFDFDRIDTGFSKFDFDKKDEYVDTTEHKLYATEHRDSTDTTIFKAYDFSSPYAGKTMNVSSEYIATDELFEITKDGLTPLWDKNPNICKWGYKDSISHSDYPYKLNNSSKVGSEFNRTTDVFGGSPDVLSKTHDYFYRVGDFYKSKISSNILTTTKQYYETQTLSVETSKLQKDYFDLDLYLNSEFDYFDYFFRNVKDVDNDGNYQEYVNYSIFSGGDKSIPSTTLFKGIKYQAHRLKGLIRNRRNYRSLYDATITNNENTISQYLVDETQNYNGYKFSVILNSRYEINNTYSINSDLVGLNNNGYLENVKFSNGVDFSTSNNGLHVFINDKYKNILVIIHVNFGKNDTNSGLTLNDVNYFDEREGLYLNKDVYNNVCYDKYTTSVLLASNYISSLNNLNDTNGFEQYITFYYKVDGGGFNTFGYSQINGNITNGLKNIDSWSNIFPPLRLECDTPESINTKKKSYITAAIKGPKFNIYDKYKKDYTEKIYNKNFIKEPLSRYIYINEKEIKPRPVYTKMPEYDNSVFRYNGPYEPIFKNIELFSPTKYEIISGGEFQQIRYGGKIKDKLSNENVKVIKKSELKKEETFLTKKLSYISNKKVDLSNQRIQAYYNDDDNELQKIDYQVAFYDNIEYESNNLIIRNRYMSDLLSGDTSTSVAMNINPEWLFKNNTVGAIDGVFANCELLMQLGQPTAAKNVSETLEVNNFNFNIPLDATINGVELTITKKAKYGYNFVSNNATFSLITDSGITLFKGDELTYSNNYAELPPITPSLSNISSSSITYWLTSTTTVTYGSNIDTWGFSGDTKLMPQDVNNEKFGVSICVSSYNLKTNTIINIAYIDSVSLKIYYNVPGISVGDYYTSSIIRNTKFDTGLYNFGEISEIIHSKINETENPLKLQDTEEDRSIYPMIDEFGYSWDKRFIFKSSWDKDFYFRTKNEIDE